MDQVYHSLLALARYFEETGDHWLSDHFYASLLKTSLKIRGDGRRKESEANCNMGLALEKKGNIIWEFVISQLQFLISIFVLGIAAWSRCSLDFVAHCQIDIVGVGVREHGY